jgi:hypothetical protein
MVIEVFVPIYRDTKKYVEHTMFINLSQQQCTGIENKVASVEVSMDFFKSGT